VEDLGAECFLIASSVSNRGLPFVLTNGVLVGVFFLNLGTGLALLLNIS
jgi:hypothetical protein